MEQRYRRKYAPQAIHHSRAPQGNTSPTASGPLIARFVEEDNAEYLVGDPWSSRIARVPKRRAHAETELAQHRPSERLLRWSAYALIGAVCGGVAGIALGAIVILATLIRLARLSSRIHRWQRRHDAQEASGDWNALPAEATRERGQLLAALGQSFLGMLLGGGVLYAILVMR